MKSACFMDEVRVLACLSMKSLGFMDGWGFEEGVVHGSALFRGWERDFGGVVHEIRLFHGWRECFGVFVHESALFRGRVGF